MRLSQIRDFLAVADTGSIRAAARSLGLTQPALTKSLRQLEAELGAVLVTRSVRGIVFTALGQAFLTRARSIDGDLRRAREEIAQLQERERQRIQQQQKELDQQRAQREEESAVDAILAKASKAGPGAVRYYFETADGSLPWLEVSPREAQELRAGQVCIVTQSRVGAHDYRLLSLELTRRVARLRKEAIVHAPRGVAG